MVYTVIRARHAHDARWDSHFGEMLLDSTTVSGLQGGEVRFIAYDYPPGSSAPYLLTDEQPNVTVAGDYLFGGHWEAGFAARILDRSAARGSFSAKITTQRLATIVTSQDNAGACGFSAAHYCAGGLENTRFYDFGFYLYYRQGAVYDRYWSEYAVWVVSNENMYFRSVDGAIVALTSGNPQASAGAAAVEPAAAAPPPDAQPVAIIPHTAARVGGAACHRDRDAGVCVQQRETGAAGVQQPAPGEFQGVDSEGGVGALRRASGGALSGRAGGAGERGDRVVSGRPGNLCDDASADRGAGRSAGAGRPARRRMTVAGQVAHDEHSPHTPAGGLRPAPNVAGAGTRSAPARA